MDNVTEISDLLKRDGMLSEEKKEEIKPYTMRKLSSKELSPMLKVLKKLNFKKLKDVFKEINLETIISASAENSVPELDNENISEETIEETSGGLAEKNSLKGINFEEIGKDIMFDLFPIILDSIDEAIPEINKLLAGVIEQDVIVVENMDLGTYFNLLYDFIHKEEFVDFIKVASRFMKWEN